MRVQQHPANPGAPIKRWRARGSKFLPEQYTFRCVLGFIRCWAEPTLTYNCLFTWCALVNDIGLCKLPVNRKYFLSCRLLFCYGFARFAVSIFMPLYPYQMHDDDSAVHAMLQDQFDFLTFRPILWLITSPLPIDSKMSTIDYAGDVTGKAKQHHLNTIAIPRPRRACNM